MNASVRSPHNPHGPTPEWDRWDESDTYLGREKISGLIWEADKLGLTDGEMWAIITLAPDCDIVIAGVTFRRVHNEALEKG